jgi:molecular chaperone GrpE
MIFKQLLGGLKSLGVEQFGKAGEKFDPYKYEALREVATTENEKDHTVESVERSGYSIGERIIRPAQVSVYTV